MTLPTVDTVPSDQVPNSDGAPKKRGRPKGSRNTGRRKSTDVTLALGTMSTLYGVMVTGAMLTGHPATAMQISNGIDSVQEANKQAFESSPKLAHTIAALGETSGVAIFITANAMMLVPAIASLRAENRAKHDAATE